MQALCFLAGANSIFFGEKLLTTGNPERDHDRELLDELGVRPLVPQHLSNCSKGADRVGGATDADRERAA